MIPTLSIKGHRCIVTAHVHQSRALHLISLVGVRESVRAALAAMQNGHNAVLTDGETHLVSFAFQSTKVTQGRLPSGAFHAIAVGQRVTAGDVILLKEGAPFAERFYNALLTKSNLPLHTSWQDKLLELARETKLITPIAAYGVQAYALDSNLSSFETQVRHALIRGELPKIGETPCG